MKTLRVTWMGASAGILLSALPAQAQFTGSFGGGGGSGRFNLPDTAPSGVMERNRPGSDPQGIRIADMLFVPRFFATTVYDDNVFTARRNRQSDVVFRLSPGFTMTTSGARAQLAVDGGFETVNYARFGVLDAINARFGALGRYDVNSTTSISAASTFTRTTDVGAGVGNATINPGAGSVPVFGPSATQIEPIPVNRFNQNVTVDTGINRFQARFSVGWQR